MTSYGYIRVSSKDQNEDRQLIAMQEAGVPRHLIYIDKQSGKDFERPAYQRMLRQVKAGETFEFVPTAYATGNGTEMAKKSGKVIGTVTSINRKHRWYRVTYKPMYDREQHECFKF